MIHWTKVQLHKVTLTGLGLLQPQDVLFPSRVASTLYNWFLVNLFKKFTDLVHCCSTTHYFSREVQISRGFNPGFLLQLHLASFTTFSRFLHCPRCRHIYSMLTSWLGPLHYKLIRLEFGLDSLLDRRNNCSLKSSEL